MTTATALHDAANAAWLRAIAKHGWRDVSVDSAAALSGMSAEALIALAGDKFDAVAAFHDRLSQEAAKGAAVPGSARDRLFDGLMRAFDVLQEHRDAVLALWNSRDPGLAIMILGRSRARLRRLAGAAGVQSDGWRGELRLAVLAGIIAKTFATWRADDSADMAATMSELDHLLARAERVETEGMSPNLLGVPGLRACSDLVESPASETHAEKQ